MRSFDFGHSTHPKIIVVGVVSHLSAALLQTQKVDCEASEHTALLIHKKSPAIYRRMTPMQASRQSEFMGSHLIGPSPGRRTDVYKVKCYCAILCVIVLCNTLLMNPLQRFLAQNMSAAAGDWTPSEPRLQHLEFQLNETRSLLQQRLALPTTSIFYNTSFDLFWLHIEKTGTSFFNTIFLNLCPRILAEHPEVLQSKLIDGRLLSRFPPSQWCEATVLNMPCPGCHFPYKERDTLFTTFTMFRDPLERLQSAYAFQRHGSKLNDTNISFETYINESHVRRSSVASSMPGIVAAPVPDVFLFLLFSSRIVK
jgi:hypothetical protein